MPGIGVPGGPDCSSLAKAMAPGGVEVDVPLPLPLPMPATEAQVHAQREFASAAGRVRYTIMSMEWPYLHIFGSPVKVQYIVHLPFLKLLSVVCYKSLLIYSLLPAKDRSLVL